MYTILGAGGAIGNELVQMLAAARKPYRLVARKAVSGPGAPQIVTADLADRDQAIGAVAGSSAVFLLVGLKYDRKVWAELWPRIMANTIEACKRANARLLFFDNVYMYGRVRFKMTEETPYVPVSRKGEIRAKIASSLIGEWRAGNLTGMIARSADFYGPNAKTGIPNALYFDPMAKKQKAMCLMSDSLPHSYTYTPDAAQALLKLAETESAWNQSWHLPTHPDALTAKEFIGHAAGAMNVPPKYRVLGKLSVRAFGLINPVVGEIYEMLYQNDAPYLFDSSKYTHAFGVEATSYSEGIRVTAASYHSESRPGRR